MCEQTMPYSVGTLLWFKTPINIWWPAKVVDASIVPEDLHEYREKMKKLTLAVVYFITENKYEWITNMEKVCLYSSPKKMDFIEKGYSTYLKQKNGAKFSFNMEYFINDVKHFEKEIGGNVNIFDEVERNLTHLKTDTTKINQLIKELFKTSKQTKKGVRKSLTDEKNIRKSITTTKTAELKLKSTTISTSFSYCPPVTKHTAPRTSRKKTHSPPNNSRNTIRNSPNNASNKNLNYANTTKNKTRNALPVRRTKNHSLLQEPKGKYVCFSETCNYSATRFYLLKRHLDTCHIGQSQSSYDAMQKHKNQILAIESKKRKRARNGRKEMKKMKTDLDNIIKDWSDDSDNVKPDSEDINTLIEQKDSFNTIFDFHENESEKVFDRLRGNNSHSNHVDEDSDSFRKKLTDLCREIDESKELIKKDPDYVNESVLNSSDGNAVKKDITVDDQSSQFYKESVNLNENNHIKTENEECCITSTVKTNLEVQNDQKDNRIVNNITDGVECLFGSTRPTNEWVKRNSWVTFANNGMNEARKFASMIDDCTTMSLEQPHDLKLVMEEEPPFNPPVFSGAPYDEDPIPFELIRIPKVPPKYTDEELVELPEFKVARDLLNSGQHDSVTITIKGAQVIHNLLDTFN